MSLRKYLLFILLLFFVTGSRAQVNNFCGSSRFDTEVFDSVQKTTDIIYGANISSSGSNTTLMLDVYEPAGDTMTQRPLIVWVHGGSFITGTKSDGDVVSLCNHFAKRGYVCASIDYRLGYSYFPPDAPAAAQTVFRAMQDMKAAVRFFRKDAATNNIFRINPDVLFGGGSSAGAITTLHLAYLDQPDEIPAGVDTNLIGGFEGNSGNPGYSSKINAAINLCGALGNKSWMHENDIPFVSMHGNYDQTVPYGRDSIYLLGLFPITRVDGSFSLAQYADSIRLYNEMYTYFGAGHVPYAGDTAYMDTTVRFVSNFLFKYLGCAPSDPEPLANTFPTGINSVPEENLFSVYPNPGNGVFNFSFSYDEKDFKVSIFDVSGKRLYELNHVKKNTSVNLAFLSDGIYFYTIRNAAMTFSGKLIICR